MTARNTEPGVDPSLSAGQGLILAEPVEDARGLPCSPLYGDVYHAASGAWAQAHHVFLAGNGLPSRWRGHDAFCIAETGFGLGNNFLATWQAWRDDPGRCRQLHFLSFEAHPCRQADLARLLAPVLAGPSGSLARALIDAWPCLIPGIHSLSFEQGAVVLTLVLGPAQVMVREVQASVDAFFLDGFAPGRNPAMWSRELFGQLVRLSRPGATAATWCSAGHVRRALQAAGFLVEKRRGLAGKRDMSVAVLRPGLGRLPPARPSAVSIVGGGFAGAALAHALAARGQPVVVLDAALGSGAAGLHRGHTAAALTPAISRDDDIRSQLSRAGVWRASARWQSLPPAARPRRTGALLPVPDKDDARRWRAALATLAWPDTWACWLDQAQAAARTGIAGMSAGIWLPVAQCVNPAALLEGLLTHPMIRLQAQAVHTVQPAADGWRLIGIDGAVLAEASHVLLAAAGALPALLHSSGLAVPVGLAGVRGLAGQICRVPPQVAAWPPAQSIVSGKGYWLPTEGGGGVAGSTYVPADDADWQRGVPRVTMAGHALIAARVQALTGASPWLPSWRPGEVDGWAGWRAAIADRLPVIGEAAPGLWVAGAFGSRGLNWSALAADVVASQWFGEPVPLTRRLLRRIALR